MGIIRQTLASLIIYLSIRARLVVYCLLQVFPSLDDIEPSIVVLVFFKLSVILVVGCCCVLSVVINLHQILGVEEFLYCLNVEPSHLLRFTKINVQAR